MSLGAVLMLSLAAADAPPPHAYDMAQATVSAQDANATPPRWPYVLTVGLLLRETALANVPRTTLSVDPNSNLWLPGDLYRPQPLMSYPSGFLLIDGEVEWTAWLSLRGLLTTGEVRSGSSLDPPLADAITANGQSIQQALLNMSMIRELELVYASKWAHVSVGKRRYTVGQGLVYDDFALGMSVTFHPGRVHPGMLWRAELALLFLGDSPQDPTPHNPFATLSLAYTPTFFDSIALFTAYFDDLAGSLNDVMTSAVAEHIIATANPYLQQVQLSRLFLRPRSGLGYLVFAGATVNHSLARGWRLRGAAVWNTGVLSISQTAAPTLQLHLNGWAAQAELTWEPAPYWTLAGLGFAMSGDVPPNPNQAVASYGSYIGVAPYLTWSGLFFNAGLNQGIFAGRATAAGVNGHGVVGGGLIGGWSHTGMNVESRLLYLSALAAAALPPVGGGGRSYGIEWDTMVHGSVTEWLTLAAEADTLKLANFFPTANWAWRVLVQAYVAWSS